MPKLKSFTPGEPPVLYVQTGVKGVDPLLEGKGLPARSSTLVLGAPGSGKTMFGLQYLAHGARNGEGGVYVSLDEEPETLMRNADRLGLGITELVNEGTVVVVDASPIRVLPPKVKLGPSDVERKEFALATLVTSINGAVNSCRAKRLVIDPISTLAVHFVDDYDRRIGLLDLLSAISKTGCTTLLIAELGDPSLDRKYQFEEFIAHGVIVMTRILSGSVYTNVFSVEKMRGLAQDSQPHPYRIAEGGIEVYPMEPTFY